MTGTRPVTTILTTGVRSVVTTATAGTVPTATETTSTVARKPMRTATGFRPVVIPFADIQRKVPFVGRSTAVPPVSTTSSSSTAVSRDDDIDDDNDNTYETFSVASSTVVKSTTTTTTMTTMRTTTKQPSTLLPSLSSSSSSSTLMRFKLPTVSRLYARRLIHCDKRITWRQIANGQQLTRCTANELYMRGISSNILDVTPSNAKYITFGDMTNPVRTEDGAVVFPNHQQLIRVDEITAAFLMSPGVNADSLPPFNWVGNHYRWIVWKLAAMDRIKFGDRHDTLPTMLTVTRIMSELKYRYQREIDMRQTPALKLVSMGSIDAATVAAARRLVLCVSFVQFDESLNNVMLKLTDSWYSIRAIPDALLRRHVVSKLTVGTKIITYGATLSQQIIDGQQHRVLYLNGNSTRRAAWDTKLGFARPSGPFTINLATIDPNGGLIGRVRVTIVRVYPILYYDRVTNKYENEQCERQKANADQRTRARYIAAFYANVENVLRGNDTVHGSSSSSSMWDEIRSAVTESRAEGILRTEDVYRRNEERVCERLNRPLVDTLPSPRKTEQVIVARIADKTTNMFLQVPVSSCVSMLVEGAVLSISDLNINTRTSMLTVRDGRVFSGTPYNEADTVGIIVHVQRQQLRTNNNDSKSTNSIVVGTPYNEADTVGIVVHVQRQQLR
ncbi:breast cancer type 2 susceptibility protein homolog, partial [Ceratina calcarata]|uniref:Breast cancer type 2 susceptibility protein homolog n=1 Tax=Ceratina calcarata TaxID=156304 RepID=A0AAJ7JH57_9HYME